MYSNIIRNVCFRNGSARGALTVSSSHCRRTLVCFRDGVENKVLSSFVPGSPVGLFTNLYERRRFSSDVSVVDTLVNLLDREHKEEIENDRTAMPEPLEALHEHLTMTDGWKIVSDDSSSITKLYKTVDSVKVQVSFHCQDGTERLVEEEEHEQEEDQENDDANQGQEEAASVRFTVSSTKAGKTLFIVCIAQDSTVRIQNVVVAGAVQDIDALHVNGLNQSLYQGPEFTELAEDLQDAFYAYVQDYLGINEDFASYITMQFDYKEQCQYVKFLEDAKSVLA